MAREAGSSSGKGNGGAVAPGFRFYPTDEELLCCFLLKKVNRKPFFGFQPVVQIDLYKYEPSDLPALSPLKSKDKEWFFFNAVDKKYGSSSRINRATQQGYWKSTGNDRSVKNMSDTIIGMKKTLVFHHGRAPGGKRTNWVMHEYRLVDEQLENAFLARDAFVLCRIFQKSGTGLKRKTQYAAFVEEDWENDDAGGEADHEMPNGEDIQKDKQKALLCSEDSLVPNRQSIDFLSKRQEGSDDPGFLSLGLNKRPKQGDPKTSNGNGLEDLTNTIGGPSTKTMTNIEKSVPPGFLKLINILEKDILNVSMEKDTLKLELRGAQEIINNLFTHIESWTTENKDLRKVVGGTSYVVKQ